MVSPGAKGQAVAIHSTRLSGRLGDVIQSMRSCRATGAMYDHSSGAFGAAAAIRGMPEAAGVLLGDLDIRGAKSCCQALWLVLRRRPNQSRDFRAPSVALAEDGDRTLCLCAAAKQSGGIGERGAMQKCQSDTAPAPVDHADIPADGAVFVVGLEITQRAEPYRLADVRRGCQHDTAHFQHNCSRISRTRRQILAQRVVTQPHGLHRPTPLPGQSCCGAVQRTC